MHGGELLYPQIWCDYLTRSALIIVAVCYSTPSNNLYADMISVFAGKETHTNQNCLAGLAMKKFEGSITPSNI